MFTKADYDNLHQLVFRPDYPGYKPTVIEIPNGDGKADVEKRFAHVAQKYLITEQHRHDLMPYLERAHNLARQVAVAGGVPMEYMPDIRYSALRVLEYPPGATANIHTDACLYTLMLYRDDPTRFHIIEDGASDNFFRMKKINAQVHAGRLGEEIGLGRATPHEVFASDRTQYSIVYFALPDHAAKLPSGVFVGDRVNEFMSKMRLESKHY